MIFAGLTLAASLISLFSWRAYKVSKTRVAESDLGAFQNGEELLKSEFKNKLNISLDDIKNQNAKKKLKNDSLNFPSALGEGAIFAGVAIQHLLSVDSAVLDTAAQLSHQAVNNISDLHSVVGNYAHSALSGDNTQSVVEFFKGHLGEHLVASHLEEQGVHADIPAASNQAGYDLTVQGVPVNVKTISDAHDLSAHFENYSNIPAIIPGDAANIPADAIYLNHTDSIDHLVNAYQQGVEHLVVVDPALSNVDVGLQADHALDAASGSFHGHVPWITTILSSYRETKLLAVNDTTIDSALKNIVLDAAGTGGGALAGGKLGAVIGGAIGGPVGAAVGGVVGAIGGALTGRNITNDIKTKDFKEAYEKYKTECSHVQSRSRLLAKEAKHNLRECISIKQKELKSISRVLERHLSKSSGQAKEKIIESSFRSKENLLEILDLGRQVVDAEILDLTNEIKKHDWVHRLFPSGPLLVLTKKRKLMIKRRQNVNKRVMALLKLTKGKKDLTPKETLALLSMVAEFKNCSGEVTRYFDEVSCVRKQVVEHYANMVRDGIKTMVDKRKRLTNEIAVFTAEETRRVKNEMDLLYKTLSGVQNKMVKEGNKLGIKLV